MMSLRDVKPYSNMTNFLAEHRKNIVLFRHEIHSLVADEITATEMKYIPLRDLDTVTNALNFSTADSHVIGGCDIYTTKAAGGDKKLYKSIENSLESEYAHLVRLSASLSPPYQSRSDDGKGGGKESHTTRGRSVDSFGINLSRASPFGPLSQITARRTFAYLIATLNASHPDYDFSSIFKPSDFRKQHNLGAIMQHVDNLLLNLRPRTVSGYSNSALHLPPAALLASAAPARNSAWGLRMWELIDEHMDLTDCEMYAFAPAHDPLDLDDPSIWSMHYFFFNKQKKRVCYLHVRCLSVISHSPVFLPVPPRRRRKTRNTTRGISVGEGASKRASYWLGQKASEAGTANYEDDDDDEQMYDDPDDDEIDEPFMDLDDQRNRVENGYHSYEAPEYYEDDNLDDAWCDEGWSRQSGGYAYSDNVEATMEL